MQAVRELRIRITTGREAGTVSFPEGSDQGVAVLTGDRAVLVAMPIVEAGLLHCD